MPAREVPERLWHEVALAREDASPVCGWGFTVRRFQQRLYWVKYLPGQTDSVQRWPDWRQPLRLADGLGELTLRPGGRLRPPSADEPVTVRFRASGHLHIVGRHGGRKLRSSGRSWALLRGDETPRRCCFTAKRRLPQRTICL